MDTSQAVESFRGLALRHRGRTGLTQRELAIRMGAGRRTVQDWEAGVKYPSAERLQALIVVLLAAGGLTAGDEREEVAELWAAVLREAPRMRTPFDEVWFTGLLADHTAPLQTPAPAGHMSPAASGRSAADSRAVERREDWGEAPDVLDFVGRVNELATLRGWVLEERCRLVAVLGMGGIGKTTLAARLAQDLAPTFERLYWRSLRDALPTGDWLGGAISFLSDQQVVPPESEAARLAVLLQLLRDRPSLLVLDNFDTLVEPRQRDGRYRDGYAGYGRLLQAVGEGRHHSCLVVTSRESPPDLDILGGAIRTLQLGGLGVAEGQVLLADKQLSGSKDEWADLIARYGGNGLALSSWRSRAQVRSLGVSDGCWPSRSSVVRRSSRKFCECWPRSASQSPSPNCSPPWARAPGGGRSWRRSRRCAGARWWSAPRPPAVLHSPCNQ